MPARDETYRNQRPLHIVFFLTSFAMAATTIAMVMVDYNREWKGVQRTFQKKELARYNRAIQQQRARLNQQQIDQLNRRIRQQDEAITAHKATIRQLDDQMTAINGKVQKYEQAYQFAKAALDSRRSAYDILVRDAGADPAPPQRAEIRRQADTVEQASDDLEGLRKGWEDAKTQLAALQAQRGQIVGRRDRAIKRKDALTKSVDLLVRARDQKANQNFGLLAKVRDIPLMDMLAPPVQIQQIWLPQLPIDYNFAEVPRFDRCITCHQGIDRTGFEKEPQPYATHPGMKTLYAGPDSYHPKERFGCTICHGGQGSGTSFTFASHTPSTISQATRWHQDYQWEPNPSWHEPMLPSRFIEASCVKCHHRILDAPQAKKLNAGYQTVRTYGCFGCHEISGTKGKRPIGPNLVVADDNHPQPGQLRKIGPSLRHIRSKLTADFVFSWIKNPHAFRPDSRMPRFYGSPGKGSIGLENAVLDDPRDPITNRYGHTEIHAITWYLFDASTELGPKDGYDLHPAVQGNVESGSKLFMQKGCLACHAHKAADAFFQDTAAKEIPRPVFGPDLSNLKAKLDTPKGRVWLYNWLKEPAVYHKDTYMPNVQLNDQEAADIAAYLLSVEATWPGGKPSRPPLDAGALDDLVTLYLRKAMTVYEADEVKDFGIPASGSKAAETKGKDEHDLVVADSLYEALRHPATDSPETRRRYEAARQEFQKTKLKYLGRKTIGRLGCFGCHQIPGFETAKPIGTQLNDWGKKDADRLAFEHITEYVAKKQEQYRAKQPDGLDTEPFFRDQIEQHTRIGFLFQKLRGPRSYDFRKIEAHDPQGNLVAIKDWDDRLRMPKFSWADQPQRVEEVMTFILGLVAEPIPLEYVYTPDPVKLARVEGRQLINQYNCTGCHMLRMPEWTLKVNAMSPDDELPDPAPSHETDYVQLYKRPAAQPLDPARGLATVIGLSPGKQEGEDLAKIVLWDSASIVQRVPTQTSDGQPSGTTQTLPAKFYLIGDQIFTKDEHVAARTPADGGDFAQKLVAYQMKAQQTDFDKAWNRVPPPLVREGIKVQTAWTSRFVRDPYMLRPATLLRMPKFHFMFDTEPTQIAEYFPAVEDRTDPFDYVAEQTDRYVRQRTQAYVDRMARAHAQDRTSKGASGSARPQPIHSPYLRDAWDLLTTKPAEGAAVQAATSTQSTVACMSCHGIGALSLPGDPESQGPNLKYVFERFQPTYLRDWIANPKRLLPYTMMPQNIPNNPAVVPQTVFKGTPLEQVEALRDVLLNYQTVLQDSLAAQAGSPAAKGSTSGGTK